MPSSAKVGTSGSTAWRCWPMTATIFSFFCWWFTMRSGTDPTPALIWLPSISAIMGALPR